MTIAFKEDPSELFIVSNANDVPVRVNRIKAREINLKGRDYICAVESSGGNKHAAEIDVHDATVELLTRIMLSEFEPYVKDFSSALQDENVANANYELDKLALEHEKNINKIKDAANQEASNYTALTWVLSIAAVLLLAGFLFSR